MQADESYVVGQGMTPVAAYLAQDDIIRVSGRQRLKSRKLELIPSLNYPFPST